MGNLRSRLPLYALLSKDIAGSPTGETPPSQFLAVALHNYDQNHHDKSIDVVVQVDRNTPLTKSWNWNVDRQSAFTGTLIPQFQWQQNEQFRRLSQLLNQLAHGQSLYIKSR